MIARVRAKLAIASSGAAVVLSACQGCRENHPYVPYSIGELEPKGIPLGDAQVTPVADEAGAFAQQAAAVAPPDSKEWTLGGLALVAPEGTTFQLGLVRDLDGDGSVDALAIVRGKNPGDAAQVVFYGGRAGGGVQAGVAVGGPPPMNSDPSCSPLQRLSLVGPRSAFVEIGAQCAGHVEARARPPWPPSRWAAVVWVPPRAKGAGAGVPSLHFSLMVSDPPGAPTLTLDADGSDYDGDGIDDVALRVTLEGGSPPFDPGPRVSALLRWIDRPAGMSREPDQPEASFHALASMAASRAAKAKDAPTVPTLVRQVRALYGAICAEGGSPRLTRSTDARGPAGAAASPRAVEERTIVCGGASRALEDAGLAEARAQVTMGDVIAAIAALDKAQQPPASRTAARTTEAQAWIAQVAPVVPVASSLRAIGAVPLIDHGRSPSWGALTFEPSGKLLVRTLAQVVRVDPAQGDEAEAGDVPAWKVAVQSPDGSLRWSDVVDPCDGSALRATFAAVGGAGEAEGREVLLPIAGRLGARCVAGKGEPAFASPVAWGQGGLVALVTGQPVAFAVDLSRAVLQPGPTAQPTTAGAPRSPDGKTLVLPTPLGILVHGARTRLLRARELEGAYPELRDCAVSDDASRVACVRGGRAFVGIW
jgi:hypothetical protein